MKTSLFILLVSCMPVCSQAQSAVTDTLEEDTYFPVKSKPYELAYGFATLNAKKEMMFSSPGETSLELLNGILVRYKFNKLSLRLNASFFENESSKAAIGCPDCQYGKSTAKNFKIGAGLQWTPFIKKELLYVFMDCNYKSRNENSTVVDVMPGPSVTGPDSATFQRIHARANGLDLVAGLGTKLRIYKNFYFSAEAGFNQFIAENKKKIIVMTTRQSSTQISPYAFHTAVLRFYLSLTF